MKENAMDGAESEPVIMVESEAEPGVEEIFCLKNWNGGVFQRGEL